MTILEFAPAKLNLYLHITGRRADGYHDLDSLVAFASIGDEIHLEDAEDFSFVIEGPQAAALASEPVENNLVVKASQSLAELTGQKLRGKLTLIKHLPVASGIGGGSSDAAAALRAWARLWKLDPNDPRIVEAAARHGQDVPVCVVTENNYITASGTAPAPALPHIGCVLVNPNKGLPTPAVYKSYRENQDRFSPEARLAAAPRDTTDLIAELKQRGNDLYAPACRLMPEIRDIIAAMEETGSLFARMSGSGATCFGLYRDVEAAESAATVLRKAHPGWWIAAGHLSAKAARE